MSFDTNFDVAGESGGAPGHTQGRGRAVARGDGSAPDALPIFEVSPPTDVSMADAFTYNIYRMGQTILITCPREFGDRHLWPRRWDLEHLRRASR